jgi:Na+/H+-dicarboxylate symporter
MIKYDKLCMSDVMNKLIELIVGKITKKEIMVKLLFIIFIFTSYMYIRPYSFETLGDYAKYLITPVILSLFVLIIRENIIYFFNFFINYLCRKYNI